MQSLTQRTASWAKMRGCAVVEDGGVKTQGQQSGHQGKDGSKSEHVDKKAKSLGRGKMGGKLGVYEEQ